MRSKGRSYQLLATPDLPEAGAEADADAGIDAEADEVAVGVQFHLIMGDW